jgi:hypothetical protein
VEYRESRNDEWQDGTYDGRKYIRTHVSLSFYNYFLSLTIPKRNHKQFLGHGIRRNRNPRDVFVVLPGCVRRIRN